MKLVSVTILVALLSVFALTQTPQQILSNGLYWPTGSANHTSQYFSDHTSDGLAGYWLGPDSSRQMKDPSNSIQWGAYLPSGSYHLGFDILNDTSEYNHPIYAIADGQVQFVDYNGWGSTHCDEIAMFTANLSNLPSGCAGSADSSRSGSNVAIVVEHKRADGSSYYATYGHLIDSNQTPRGISNSSGPDPTRVCYNELNSSTTGIPSLTDVLTADKRQFQPCDIILAGELLGYTGYWDGGRHLHFSISPFSYLESPMGLFYYNSTDWPTGEYTPTGDLATDGTYKNQINPINFITDSGNTTNNWVQALGVQKVPYNVIWYKLPWDQSSYIYGGFTYFYFPNAGIYGNVNRVKLIFSGTSIQYWQAQISNNDGTYTPDSVAIGSQIGTTGFYQYSFIWNTPVNCSAAEGCDLWFYYATTLAKNADGSLPMEIDTPVISTSTYPTVTSFTMDGDSVSGFPTNATLVGTDFGTGTEVWFCQDPDDTECYKQPDVGVRVLDNDTLKVDAINLSPGDWKVKARNPGFAGWSGLTSSFTVNALTALWNHLPYDNSSYAYYAAFDMSSNAYGHVKQVKAVIYGTPSNTLTFYNAAGPVYPSSVTMDAIGTSGWYTYTYTWSAPIDCTLSTDYCYLSFYYPNMLGRNGDGNLALEIDGY